ncbi:methyl-accepting chemotaxis sensory transducer [Nostoc sp. NIES-3756]|uniref:methyl-accepting chemotaxis protein n=1 Tax=Nostoc sp. NIES-3756 TaxID=1751286 RepID=UPI000722A82D|nr:methyl-accepting chemotaxis protein [Nostoc sp. NIES-3756]BAT55314.1 methyl-accepting chemotaxis sensory transducer [Nostoc sp. NIES-3756]BAY36907.1 methyl-accepting chemotaxis sensory transducer [Nostoc sp. NIES-2111]
MQQGLKLNQFVILGSSLIIILTCITTYITKRTNQELVNNANVVSESYFLQVNLKDLEKLILDAETGQRGFIITNKEEYLEPFYKAKEQLSNRLNEINRQLKNSNRKVDNFYKIEELSMEKIKISEDTIQLKKQGKEKELMNYFLVNRGKKITDAINKEVDSILEKENEILEGRQKQVNQMQAFSDIVIWISFLLLVLTVVTVCLAIILIPGRALNNSLQNAFTLAEKVSKGDLTVEVEASTNDVIGKLMLTLKDMAKNLSNLIKQVQQSGIQATSSATQVAASGKQLEATLTEQVASTNEVAAAAKEISATSRELVKTMEEVAVMSQSTTIAASDSQKDLLRMETTMRQLAEATNSIAARLGVISEKANNINNIVVTITKVADQTNLLSLNAAIEAEKAGEYGLGFAVVAREIRRLADQTAVATLDIEQMVKQMQSSVSTGVMEMDKFATEVGRSVEDVANISTQVGQIIEQVQDLTPRFEVVSQGMETQSQGAQQISEAMTQLSNTSVQTASSLREINNAISQLNQVAHGLRQEISRFKVIGQ